MKLTDEMLERALRDAEDGALTELPPNAGEEHVFSSRFERKMRRVLREQNRTPSQKKKTAYCRRAAACAAAVLVVVSTAVMSVGALRNKFFHRVAKDLGEYTSIEYQTSGGQGADEALRENTWFTARSMCRTGLYWKKFRICRAASASATIKTARVNGSLSRSARSVLPPPAWIQRTLTRKKSS